MTSTRRNASRSLGAREPIRGLELQSRWRRASQGIIQQIYIEVDLLPPILAHRVDPGVSGDRQHPRRESRSELIRVELLIHLQKSLLSHVFGQRRIAKQVAEKPPDLTLMGADQLSEGDMVALRGSPDQVRVGFVHLSLRRCRLRPIGINETSEPSDLFIVSFWADGRSRGLSMLGGDAELVAVGVGHHPPGETWNLVILDVGASHFDDSGGGCFQIAYRGVEMKTPATLGWTLYPLEGDRESARSLRPKP